MTVVTKKGQPLGFIKKYELTTNVNTHTHTNTHTHARAVSHSHVQRETESSWILMLCRAHRVTSGQRYKHLNFETL